MKLKYELLQNQTKTVMNLKFQISEVLDRAKALENQAQHLREVAANFEKIQNDCAGTLEKMEGIAE